MQKVNIDLSILFSGVLIILLSIAFSSCSQEYCTSYGNKYQQKQLKKLSSNSKSFKK